ncbi:small ribosomal subunit biogenesis GTPase RsgA 1, mitochondrial [Selaginella moellendorffii]|nr:small ribosomal subunit biogenesis GTPase RsgA 1, mitochondrial [Selaginella moellendorffii]|eukprot:XP_002982215.2 small ribosomal subunit biogenesis GTPase RsgA 1, mitochondrial [Selaginella moellendorffii]
MELKEIGALRRSSCVLGLGFVTQRLPVVRCGRKNAHGPARKQLHKQWDRQRRGDSKQVSRQWNQQVRDVTTLPDVKRFDSLSTEDRAVGQVTSAQANFMTVVVERAGAPDDGLREEGFRAGIKLLCVVRALLKKIRRRVMVGDSVLVSGIDWTDKRGMIEDVLQRRSETSDPPVANVDLLLVLFSLDRPRLDPVILNRFLVEAESTGIPLAVVLNKADLVTQEMKDSWEKRLTEWGYKPYICSVETGMGLHDMAPLLEDKTSVVFGPSGVGKSSLINFLRGKSCLPPDDIQALDEVDDEVIRVNEVSYRTGSGRHTTRHVSLLHLPFRGAMLADTPGFSYPSLSMVTINSLASLFPEVRARLEKSEFSCGFADCQHISEPDCVVGGDWERYPYYVSLWNEVHKREEHEKAVFGTKQENDMRFKVRESGVKQAEPMLELKRHRRTSRRQVRQMVDSDVREQRDEQRELDELENADAAV